ncbi:Putative esterase [bacterium A37T11]|nr:Putative esterase [bacterium A37T11]
MYNFRKQLFYSVCVFLLNLISLTISAQTSYHFTQGILINPVYNYGREAVYTDELMWQYGNGTLRVPKDGTLIKADSAGNIQPERPSRLGRGGRGRGMFRSSYIYLTYQSDQEKNAILTMKGNNAVLVNGVLHAGDPYQMGFLHIPVRLKKGLNEFYVRGFSVSAMLDFPKKDLLIYTDDITVPDMVQGKDNSNLVVGIVLVNTTAKPLVGLQFKTILGVRTVSGELPAILPYSTRKVPVKFDGSSITSTGDQRAKLTVYKKNKELDSANIKLNSLEASKPYRNTFISSIDGSLQYYAVNPEIGGERPGEALFFSVHGAGVEAIGQAEAYEPKDWGTLVAPTNRRPRGFNWEDFGRLDALEVLAIAQQKLKPDPLHLYLTGHSMGGHGTWFLGATYPEKWAAIAPCSGYPTLKGYGSADGLIPDTGRNLAENTLLRASNQSDVPKLATNYKPLGVYILHGDSDQVVSVEYARQMRRILADFHPDFSAYEYPGGEHWYGNQSVDWKPLFDYFRWHIRKADTAVSRIDFITANPGISASYYWATVYQQQQPLVYSRLILSRDLAKGTIIGKTENTAILRLALTDFGAGKNIRIILDSLPAIAFHTETATDSIYLVKEGNTWMVKNTPSFSDKGPHRNGTFKEAFNHHMVWVYGTNGTKEENQWALNKARYDAESWYYRGNGSVDIVADKDFRSSAYLDRNVILIGNATTNTAWDVLVKDCPIQVKKGSVILGNKHYTGDDLAAYYVWKKPGSNTLSVGVIGGTGLKGMQAAIANQYFAGGSGFTDYLVFHHDMLKVGAAAIEAAGYYDNQWKIE